MKIKRKIIDIDPELCDGCGQCVPSCAEGAIQIVDGKARLVAEKYCDGLGACLGECPTGALKITERESEDFDPAAVEEHLQALGQQAHHAAPQPPLACGCPSTQLQCFGPAAAAPSPGPAGLASSLTHWPVKIRLVPPTAPFLKGADLLVTADCVPFSYPNFHADLLPGKVVLIGCPKFDDIREYIDKFTQIFQAADINSVTTVIMEVPCCSGLGYIVDQAMAAAGKKIPHEQIVIGTRGQVLHREPQAA